MGSLFCVLILAGLASLADRGAGSHLLSWFFCCTAVALPVMAMSDMTEPDNSPATLAAYTLALVLYLGLLPWFLTQADVLLPASPAFDYLAGAVLILAAPLTLFMLPIARGAYRRR